MRTRRGKSGFTMAEMLIVTAIIAVLGGVIFIMVSRYQRSLAHLERDAVAKEIFVAAQNHLTVAESQGYLGISKGGFGTLDSDASEENREVYYFDVNRGNRFTSDNSTVLDLMLPFASIDETVRAGGSYIIRYQADPAVVLDVFYCSASDTRFGHDLTGDYGSVLGLIDKNGSNHKSERRNYSGGSVLGWYGGEGTLETGAFLKTPQVEVFNEERLTVTVTDPNKDNSDASLKLIITGETSKAQAAVKLSMETTNIRVDYEPAKGIYTITLDDITTAGMHFADLNTDMVSMGIDRKGSFLPGENITVKAVAYSNAALTNIAYSSEKTTNSLFADLREEGSGEEDASGASSDAEGPTALIRNFRHLENLDDSISGVNKKDGSFGVGDDSQTGTLVITRAEQIADLSSTQDGGGLETGGSGEGGSEAGEAGNTGNAGEEGNLSWPGFADAIRNAKNNNDKIHVYKLDDSVGSEDDCYCPISPSYELTYEGKNHSISEVRVNDSTAAGLFGEPKEPLSVNGLVLVDFSITGTGSANAGALAGKLPEDSSVTNVLAYNSPDWEKKSSVNIIAESGNAGGLIGTMNNCSVVKSAAALIVESGSGNAGGLAGESTGGTVSGCYSGGHTEKGKGAYSAETYNVTASGGNAGGLIGITTGTDISGSYSTCSAAGTTAGGLIGSGSGKITGCYAVGLVGLTEGGTAEGAFAGEYTGSLSDCLYFEIINERADEKEGTWSYLPALGNNPEAEGVTALDATPAAYNEFTGSQDKWKDAVAYDSQLTEWYKGKYNLRTVAQLNTDESFSVTDTDYVSKHYGDWPAPEIFVINQ